jgi:Skp family chaperone for outer membrane proteins
MAAAATHPDSAVLHHLSGTHLAASYHAKELAAANQTSRRLQEVQLQHMQQKLQTLEQQLEIEGAVPATTVSFLNLKAGSLQEATASWHSKREEDALNREQELEVSNSAAVWTAHQVGQAHPCCLCCGSDNIAPGGVSPLTPLTLFALLTTLTVQTVAWC